MDKELTKKMQLESDVNFVRERLPCRLTAVK